MRGSLRRSRGWHACPALALVVGLVTGASAQSDPLCPHIVACEYEAPAFTIRVVDQQTGQPLADVHAIASWVVYGGHGGLRLLMVFEAVSGADGTLAFPAWGPVRSAVEGLLPGLDPVISLFRPGYRVELINNATPPGQPHTVRVHAFGEAGKTFELVAFQGTTAQAIMELRKAEDPFDGGRMTQYDPVAFRQAYASRLRRVRAEVERLPRYMPQVDHFLRVLEDDIRFFDAGGRP